MKQPVRRLCVVFRFGRRKNVPDRYPLHRQLASDQYRPMARQRLPFRAKQRQAILFHAVTHAFEPFLEDRRASKPVELHLILDITREVQRPRAQLFSKKNVSDARRFQGSSEYLPVELRMHSAVGLRAHVGNGRNPMAFYRQQKIFQRTIRVADGVERFIHGKSAG